MSDISSDPVDNEWVDTVEGVPIDGSGNRVHPAYERDISSVTGSEPREVLAYALMVAKGANSLQYDDADITIVAIQREAVATAHSECIEMDGPDGQSGFWHPRGKTDE